MSESTWLKIASNGALGEARVRALLLERFHVLTRSIDAEGADFLIQLPASGRFSDALAPRLGIIQAKFSQSEATSHLVPVEYALDQGRTISEFFVLITSGREDNARNYLLSGADLGAVRRTAREGKEFYSLTASGIAPFAHNTVSSLLDKIEDTLKQRSNEQNERFYKTVTIPEFEIKRSSLDPKWLLGIPNEVAFIPDLIYRIRVSMRANLYALDDITEAISKLLTSEDAADCAKYVESITHDRVFIKDNSDEYFKIGPLISGSSSLSILRDALLQAVDLHETRMRKLIEAGQLDRFASAAHKIFERLIEFFETQGEPKFFQVSDNERIISNEHARTTISLDPATLDVIDVVTDLVSPGSYDRIEGSRIIVRSRPLWEHTLIEGPNGTLREVHRIQHLILADLYYLMFPEEGRLIPMLPMYMAE